MTHADHDHPSSDVLVIGGGIIGLSIAWRLGREGLSVTLLERGALGREASWSAAGVLAAGNWQRTDPLVRFQRESLRMYADWCATIAEAGGLDPEYRRCGTLELLLNEQQFRMALAEADVAEALPFAEDGPVLRLLTPAEAREIEPRLAGHILGAKLCTFNAQVRNPRLLKALAAAATRTGVRLVEGCPVTGLVRQASRITGAHTPIGRFAAGHTVLCAGAWSAGLDDELGRLMPVYPVRGQIALLRTAPGPRTCILKHRKWYAVPRLDGLMLIGSTEEHDSGFQTSTTAQGVAHLLSTTRALLPPIGEAQFVAAWAGLRPGTPDRKPYIGPVPDHDGLIAATGHFRTGLGLAPLTAEVVADLILRGRTDWDISLFRPGRT